MRLCRSRNLSEHFGEEKDLLRLPCTHWRSLGCPALRLVTVLTELLRLCRWDCFVHCNALSLLCAHVQLKQLSSQLKLWRHNLHFSNLNYSGIIEIFLPLIIRVLCLYPFFQLCSLVHPVCHCWITTIPVYQLHGSRNQKPAGWRYKYRAFILFAI